MPRCPPRWAGNKRSTVAGRAGDEAWRAVAPCSSPHPDGYVDGTTPGMRTIAFAVDDRKYRLLRKCILSMMMRFGSRYIYTGLNIGGYGEFFSRKHNSVGTPCTDYSPTGISLQGAFVMATSMVVTA